MMDLSIIVPAFNCSSTIKDTLVSLEPIINQCSGKLIIVDDGSTDDTLLIIRKWEKRLGDKILFLQHEKNLGGGAARNTGIRAAKSTYVIVCDSDDISNLESVKLLYETAALNDFGAAHYQFAHFFRNDYNKIDSVHDYLSTFGTQKISLEGTIINSNSLLVNFLFKKQNWEKAGGYPEHHGWDTQGYSIRYLLNNSGVNIAKGTFYNHRRFFGRFSYYEREHMSGNNLINSWLTIEELLGKVPETWFSNFISSPILSKVDSISLIKQNIQKQQNDLSGIDEVIDKEINSEDFKMFTNAIIQYQEGKYKESIESLSRIQLTYPSEIILYVYVRSLLALNKSIINPSYSAFDFFRNIGKGEQSLRVSRVQSILKLLNIYK